MNIVASIMGICIYREKICSFPFRSHLDQLASLAIMHFTWKREAFFKKIKVKTRVDIELFFKSELEESKEICSM